MSSHRATLIYEFNVQSSVARATLWARVGDYDPDMTPPIDEDPEAIRLIGPADTDLINRAEIGVATLLAKLGIEPQRLVTADD